MSQSEFVWCPLIFTAETIVANIYEAIPILLALGISSGSDGKESTCNAGDTENLSSIPGSGRSPGEGYGNPLQYSCMGNPMDREPGGLQSLGLKELDTIEVTEHNIAVDNASS